MQVTDFLDVTFNLKNGKYYPFRKSNNEPLYIHAQSNHPPSIIKEIPNMINKRISEISCDEEQFEKAKPMYEKALENSGYKAKLKYVPKAPNPRRNRKSQIIRFNPPLIGVELYKTLKYILIISYMILNHKQVALIIFLNYISLSSDIIMFI